MHRSEKGCGGFAEIVVVVASLVTVAMTAKALIIAYSSSIQLAYKEILDDTGFNSESVRCLKEASELLDQGKFYDMIVVDSTLDLDPFLVQQFTKQIREYGISSVVVLLNPEDQLLFDDKKEFIDIIMTTLNQSFLKSVHTQLSKEYLVRSNLGTLLSHSKSYRVLLIGLDSSIQRMYSRIGCTSVVADTEDMASGFLETETPFDEVVANKRIVSESDMRYSSPLICLDDGVSSFEAQLFLLEEFLKKMAAKALIIAYSSLIQLAYKVILDDTGFKSESVRSLQKAYELLDGSYIYDLIIVDSTLDLDPVLVQQFIRHIREQGIFSVVVWVNPEDPLLFDGKKEFSDATMSTLNKAFLKSIHMQLYNEFLVRSNLGTLLLHSKCYRVLLIGLDYSIQRMYSRIGCTSVLADTEDMAAGFLQRGRCFDEIVVNKRIVSEYDFSYFGPIRCVNDGMSSFEVQSFLLEELRKLVPIMMMGANTRVLIVDSSTFRGKMHRELFKNSGCDCVILETVAEVLKIYSNPITAFDLVLMSVTILDGIWTTKKLRMMGVRDCIVGINSAMFDLPNMNLLLNAGFDEYCNYVTKETVRSMLQKAKLKRFLEKGTRSLHRYFDIQDSREINKEHNEGTFKDKKRTFQVEKETEEETGTSEEQIFRITYYLEIIESRLM